MRNAVRDMDAIVYRLIDSRAAEPREALLQRPDLLTMLLLMTDEEGDGRMSRQQLRDEILTLFLAGHETTSQTLTWTLYLLSQHPEAEARLHEELDRVLAGRLANAADELPYTDRVIAESMRLFPPVCVVARVCTEPTEVGGYPIPAGADVVCWIYMTHLRRRAAPVRGPRLRPAGGAPAAGHHGTALPPAARSGPPGGAAASGDAGPAARDEDGAGEAGSGLGRPQGRAEPLDQGGGRLCIG